MTVIDGPTLRALRIQRRVPLRKVARMARMSHGHLSKVERNEAGRPVTPAVLAAYGHAIGVDLTDIKPSETKGGWQPGQLNTSARRWFTGKVAAVAWGAQLDDRLNQFLAIRGKLALPTDIDQAQLSQLSQLAALLASLPGPVPGLVARVVLEWVVSLLHLADLEEEQNHPDLYAVIAQLANGRPRPVWRPARTGDRRHRQTPAHAAAPR